MISDTHNSITIPRRKRKQAPGRHDQRKKDFCYTTHFARLPSGWYRWSLVDELGNVGAYGKERLQNAAAKAARAARERLHAELEAGYARRKEKEFQVSRVKFQGDQPLTRPSATLSPSDGERAG